MERSFNEHLAEVDRWKEAASKKSDRKRNRGALNDTAPEAERVLIDIYRKMSFDDKWRQIAGLYRTAKLLHEAGFRQRRPDASAAELLDDWMELTIEPELLQMLRESRHGSVR